MEEEIIRIDSLVGKTSNDIGPVKVSRCRTWGPNEIARWSPWCMSFTSHLNLESERYGRELSVWNFHERFHFVVSKNGFWIGLITWFDVHLASLRRYLSLSTTNLKSFCFETLQAHQITLNEKYINRGVQSYNS